MSTHPYNDLMLKAVALAGQARWKTFPNPTVGALLVKDGVVAASGMHKGAGLPHAEIEALEDARNKGVNPAECVMVVTLEPCRHHGRTPPCTDAIIAAGIRHVVIGVQDPNPDAAGGAEVLRAAGVQVEMGAAQEECLDLIDDFITWQASRLPYTLLKLAATMDGRIASRSGHSKWISSAETRNRAHYLRRHMQAIIVGGNTFYQDDPQLTCRISPEDDPDMDPCAEQPLAVVVTSRLPEAGQPLYLLKNRAASTIFWTTVAAAASPKAEALRRMGIRVLGLPSEAKTNTRGFGMRAELDVTEGFMHLREELGCHYVLCEGGGRLGLSLLDKGLAREFHLHLAPKILGDNQAIPLFDGRTPLNVEQALQLRITDAAPSGSDIVITMRPAVSLQSGQEQAASAGRPR
ncbi:MAG: bifunctional diaminohydroxyphosphoribosylaminopyrimidine deaminase/5-amino-6-(5-phosphoribosylamino)uracil reductase RibD [Desulfovibrio sp.]|jgi:diaminohydroxyphosphoribosylaminopyrimidine deaminase/5-amino-6-(5-phosphoribosylamino)uracil reductase|nr:bifunctional diaminohydroxyphosphoribosylaminopyrimidine deaminase/5-amino-6-(5-phosphoribosylamino)uracil reductase RibD [Desulfovibrio sp.]